MSDISTFGISAQVIASQTFPSGFTVTEFADDADSLDVPSVAIRDKAMGANGDLITWSKASPTVLTLNVVPGSEDDINLGILYDANRVGKGKISARDIIDITVLYPDGHTTSFVRGVMTDGMPSNGASSAGRMKTKAYMFAFENINRN